MSIETFTESIFPLWLYFIYLLRAVASCCGSGSWGYLGCISALRSKDIIHCARQQQQQHEWQRARALGALESAGADNNSYMWHDEFLATRRSFLLVSLSSRTPGHFLWTQLGRKTDRQTEREGEAVLLSTNVVIAAQVS